MLNRRTMVILAALIGTACSKEKLGGVDDDDTGKGGLIAPVELAIESPSTLDLGFGQSATVVARLVYAGSDRAVPGQTVTWATEAAPSGASVSETETVTDEDGRVQAQVVAGDTKGTFQVILTTPQYLTEELVTAQVTVNIDGVYRGDLKVDYTYDGAITLKDIETRIHPGAVNCAGIDFSALPGVVEPPAESMKIAPSPSATLTFGGLAEEVTHSVTAIGLNAMGEQVAFGCAVSDAIVGRGQVSVTVPLDLTPVTVVGVYDFATPFKVFEALPEPYASNVERISSFFSDPGTFIATEIATAMGLDPNSSDFVEAALADLVISSVAGFVNDNLPGWAMDALTIGGDLTGLLTDLKIGGKLDIQDVTDTGTLTGHWDWTDFLWQWRQGQGCALDNVCCGRTVYSGAEMGLAPMGADITGSVAENAEANGLAFDLTIDEHRLDFQYGTIIAFLLNQFVLPELTGQSSIECAVESMLGCNGAGEFACGQPNSSTNTDPCGCDRLGAWLENEVGSAIAGLGVGACQAAMDSAATYVENELADMVFSGSDNDHILMAATALLSDDDRDLQTDLIEGTTAGSYVRNGIGSPFTGGFKADIERTLCTSDTACQTNDSCQARFHPLDTCTGRQVCVRRVGDRVAGEGCTADDQCSTGTCLNGTTCFTACGEDLDCPGSLTCGIDAAEIVVTDTATLTVNACGL